VGRPDQEPLCVRLIGGWSSCRVVDWSVRETRWADGWIKRTHITRHLSMPPPAATGMESTLHSRFLITCLLGLAIPGYPVIEGEQRSTAHWWCVLGDP